MTIAEIIGMAFVVAFYVQAVWICFQEGMIFEWAANYFMKNLPDFMRKPLYDCPICMVPWHGALFLFILSSYSAHPVSMPGIFISGIILLVAMGINTTITKLWPHD